MSHQVHGNNISRHKRENESVILPQYLISHRVITSSEGANFWSRTVCLSPQCKVSVLLLGLMSNSSHLNATVSTDYDLVAIDQSLQVVTQQFNDRPTKHEIGESGRKRQSKLKVRGSTIVMVRLEPGNSDGRIRGNAQCGISRWEMKTNCGSSFLF